MGIPVQMKIDNAPVYASSKVKQFYAYYNTNDIKKLSHNPSGQVVTESSESIFKYA